MSVSRLLLSAIATLLLLPNTAMPFTLGGKVVAISNDNTIVIEIKDRKVSVALAHVDIPDVKQPFGDKAKEQLSGILLDKKVTVSFMSNTKRGSDGDFYCECLACMFRRATGDPRGLLTGTCEECNGTGKCPASGEVLLDGKPINRELVESGYAWATDKRYMRQMADAKQKKKGLWDQAEPVSPAEWRKSHRAPASTAAKYAILLPDKLALNQTGFIVYPDEDTREDDWSRGKPVQAKVVQVLSDDELLIRFAGVFAILHGKSTKGIVTDHKFRMNEAVTVSDTRTYQTAAGGTNTVFVLTLSPQK